MLTRTDFSRGWCPDADASQGPLTALLRADNLVLDELGVIAVRQGSTKINSAPLSDTDVHSLFTTVLSGTRYRMAGASSAVYANGSTVATGLAGSGDIAFGSHLGQILFARGSSTKKFDGSTVRNWGLAMTGSAPTVATIASDAKTLATCDVTESPGFVADEDDGTGVTFGTGQDGTAGGAAGIFTNATSNRATMTKIFAAPTDCTAYDGGGTGTDDDLLQLYIEVPEPNDFVGVTIMVDVNPTSAGLFQDDYYTHQFIPGDVTPLGPVDGVHLPVGLNSQAPHRNAVAANVPRLGTAVPRASLRLDHPVITAGWSKLLVRRGDMIRTGSTSGKDWSTVKAIRIVISKVQADPLHPVLVDSIRLIANPLNGRYKWCYVYGYNSGSYVALSAPSPLSAETQLQAAGGTITVPADGSRDSQTNECWLYRMGGVMDAFYRVAVKTSGLTGSFTISDTLSDLDAMTVGLKLQTDNATPPSGIISIAGPYYDRTCALTTTALYVSKRLNPDSFASGQVITMAGADEVALWVRKALGGLYVATTKDLYRIDGTGAELPDGSIDFTKTPLNIDHPPINDGVAQDGNLLIYFADDGWRAIAGAGSSLIVGDTSLLYKGHTRHGRGPVNTTTGRFRATVAHGHFLAITPEDTETTGSARLYRQAPLRGAWYYTEYPRTWRSLHREPDGTLIAGDTRGTVWVLDSGTGDDGAGIAVTLWTKVDDDGEPFVRKDPIDLRVNLDTGGVSVTAAVHLNGSSSAAQTATINQTGLSVAATDISSLAAFRQAQLRLTGTVTTFRFGGFSVNAVPLPLPVQGEVPPTTFGTSKLKTFSGFQGRLCTLGVERLLTPILDGVSQTALAVTSGVDEPTDVTYQFTAPVTATESALSVDGDIELYEWAPIITVTRPLGVRSWDSGPIDLGDRELVWLRRLDMKVNAGAALVVTAYLDGVAVVTTTATVTAGVDTIVWVDLPRGTKGRQPRLVVTSTQPFYPYWIRAIERVTGLGTGKPSRMIPVTLGGGAV